MISKIYVEKSRKNDNYPDINFFASADGFESMGYDVKTFYEDEIKDIKITKEIIFHATIQTTDKILKHLNIDLPPIPDYHKNLKKYCGRNFKETTLGKIRSYYNKYPYHIKPLKEHKKFNGRVIMNNYVDLFPLKHLSDDLEILESEYVEFMAEFRCFILRKELLDMSKYKGSFGILPDFGVIKNAIIDYEYPPVSYSMDFGITKEGKTLLIEINDSLSLGRYNLNKFDYCNMIIERWKEIYDKYWK